MVEDEHTVLAAAAVHLERVLVAKDIDLDAGPCTAQTGNRALLTPVEWTVLSSVDKIACVITCAVGSAVAEKVRIREVCADLLGP